MIITVSESRQLHNAWIVRSLGAEHLREYGMRHRYVQALVARVCDANANVVHSCEVVVKASEERLTSRGVDRGMPVLLPNPFHEDLGYQFGIGPNEEIDNPGKESCGLPGIIASTDGDLAPDVRPFYLFKHGCQEVGGWWNESGEI